MTRLDDARARELDAADPLASFRSEFDGPPGSVYLCGHSLGLMPRSAAALVHEELEDWRRFAVAGHRRARRPWVAYHERLAEPGARLVGALPEEVVFMNTLTVNVHLLMVSFYRPTAERHVVLIEDHAFPSDHYAVASQIRWHGFDPATSLRTVGLDEDVEAVIEEIGDELALVWLGGVNYYNGRLFDLASVTSAAHRAGALAGFDLAHAVGNVPLELHDWNVDFAAWCTYKYLNSGPGSVAGAFVHERHGDGSDRPRFAGWWGHDKQERFRMAPDFVPIPGAEGWQLSNPPILSLAPVVASLEIFDRAGMDALRRKSVVLTAVLEHELHSRFAEDVEVLTPSTPDERGCQLSLRLRRRSGRAIYDAIEAMGVHCDWREPDVIRVAPVPLYNGYGDVAGFLARLEDALAR